MLFPTGHTLSQSLLVAYVITTTLLYSFTISNDWLPLFLSFMTIKASNPHVSGLLIAPVSVEVISLWTSTLSVTVGGILNENNSTYDIVYCINDYCHPVLIHQSYWLLQCRGYLPLDMNSLSYCWWHLQWKQLYLLYSLLNQSILPPSPHTSVALFAPMSGLFTRWHELSQLLLVAYLMTTTVWYSLLYQSILTSSPHTSVKLIALMPGLLPPWTSTLSVTAGGILSDKISNYDSVYCLKHTVVQSSYM